MKRNIYVQFKQHQGQGNNPWSFFMEKNMNTEKIKHLNDNLRKTFANGKIVITPGVRALGLNKQQQLFSKVKSFDNFSKDKRPFNGQTGS